MEKSIELVNVSAGYLSETILTDVNFSVKKRNIVGVFGPNGAGKTTLLCAINGLAKIWKGKIYINGISLSPFTSVSLRKKIGYVPQIIEVDTKIPALTEEVILMGGYGRIGVFHFPNKKDYNFLKETSELLEISSLLKKPFGQLSGGEQRRALIARALFQKPEILLLDEIFSFLDWKIKKKISELIIRIHNEKNLTTLIVSHDLKVIEELCDNVVYIEKGKIIYYGEKGEFLRRINSGDF